MPKRRVNQDVIDLHDFDGVETYIMKIIIIHVHRMGVFRSFDHGERLNGEKKRIVTSAN